MKMTKFEEKLEILPIKTIQHPVGDTKYYAAVHVKTLIAQADEEIANLKSQLQQQALPVVPERVAEWIEILKTKGLKPLKNPETYGETGFTEEKLQNIVFWISEHQEDYMRAWLDGYTVEKPQLFYLREKNTNYYLNKSKNNGLELVPNPYFDEDNQFTKQEIGSMQTGSYEQIEVAE
ncbi:DUF1642 domain-containing protein [Lactococcus lactis]|uniref:DUF1642 domain-containing protein n=2 Tax=Lactococcus lactis TaxID=1358 RepID=UPI003BF9841C